MNKMEVEKELLDSRRWLDSDAGAIIKSFLAGKFEKLLNLFILHHHFNQAEEYYIIMVNGEYITELEVCKGEVVNWDKYEINKYLKANHKMPKLFRRRIETAQALSAT